MSNLRPFELQSRTLKVTLLGRPGRPVSLESVISSTLDFQVEVKPMNPVTTRVNIELKWEILTSSSQETLITAYFIGKSGNHTVVHTFKVFLYVALYLTKIETKDVTFPGLRDQVLEDGKTMYYTIWMHNPTERPTNVIRIFKNDNTRKGGESDNQRADKLGVTNPWNCHQRIRQSAEPGSIIGSVDSPSDWWRFGKGHRKPIAEVNYTAVTDHKNIHSQEWLNTRIRVETTIEIYQGNLEKRYFDIPIRIFKPTGTHFYEEQVVDMGIITSPDAAHRYVLRLQNKLPKPVVVLKVSIQKQCKGMNIKFATPFNNKIPIPGDAEPFDFMWLFSHPDRKALVGFCSGSIQLKMDVSGKVEKYTIPFTAGYYKHLLADDDAMGFQLTKKLRDGGKVINKFEAKWKSRFPVDLVIHELVFSKSPRMNYRPNARNLRIAPGAEVSNAFIVEVVQDENDFMNKYSNSNEFALVNTLGSQVSLLMRFYTLGLMCGLHNAISLSYEKCKPVESISFGYVAVGQRKVITMDIFNPTMVNYIVKRVEFNQKDSDVEISFENQSKTGMKSYYKKARKTMNTFFLLPRTEVVSIRIKVKPKASGNFRDSITIHFSRGEITLQVTYSGISGSLEFSPPSLRYDLFYPIESDEQQVSVINKFNANIEITTAWSPQSFVFTNVYGSIIDANHKTPFMAVTIDLSPDEIMDAGRPNYLRPLHSKALPALSDLIRHKDQLTGWDRLVREKQTEVTGEVVVQTELMSDQKIPVKATLRKACIVSKDQLVIGPLEEQRLHYISVNLTNPTKRNITMRFFLADSRMLDAESIKAKVERRLRKRYSNFKHEVVCLMHKHLSEDDIRYFMETIFEGVKSIPRLKALSPNHHCFILNNSNPAGKKFFEAKGNFLFDMQLVSRFSRKHLMRENDDIYYLKDVIRMSRSSPPTNPQSLFGLSFMEKLSVHYARLVSQLGDKLNQKQPRHFKKKSYYLSSMKETELEKLLQNQEVFLNPKFRYRNITLAPQQQISLPILVCRPKEFSEIEKSNISLLIKNDYSNLAIIPIKVSLGKIGLIVDKVIAISDDNRVIYPQTPEEYYQLVFNIHPNDIVQKLSKNDAKKIVFKKGTRRLYELKNTGNLPIKVKEVVAGEGCNFSGFKITNCQGFELAPNHTHRLEIVLARPNSFEIDFKKEVKLILEGRVLTLEFKVQTNPLATSDAGSGGFTLVELATKSFTDAAASAYRYIVILFLVILVVLFFKHYQEKTQVDPHFVVTSLDQLRYRSEYFHDNIFDINYLETTLKYKTLEAQKNKHIRNIGLKQLMSPSQPELPSRDASVHSENQESEPAPVKKGKGTGGLQLNKVVPAQTKLPTPRQTPPSSDQKQDPKKQREEPNGYVPDPRPPVPPVNIRAVAQETPQGKGGKKKKQKRSEHIVSELTSPRVDENLTQNILAQLGPPETTIPLAHPSPQVTKQTNSRKNSSETRPHKKTAEQSGTRVEPVVEPEIVEHVPEPDPLPQDNDPAYSEVLDIAVTPHEPENTAHVEEVVEPQKPEKFDTKIRSRKGSAAQRQSGNHSSKGDHMPTKGDHSQHSGQASQGVSVRGNRKGNTPQNRGRNERNRKYSRSEDEESEETFVPKHQVANQSSNKDARGRPSSKPGNQRDPTDESEPEYKVKETQASPVQASQTAHDPRHIRNHSKEDSFSAPKEETSAPLSKGRRGTDSKPAGRVEKEVSPKRNPAKKKNDMVYYQKVDKSKQEGGSVVSESKRERDTGAGNDNHQIDPQPEVRSPQQHYIPKETTTPIDAEPGEEEQIKDPKEVLRKEDASFLEEEGNQGHQFNQHMISFNNQDISAIDNLEDGASNTSQVFPTKEDLPAREKLASRLHGKRPSIAKPDEESEDDVGYINRSREHIRKHMELEQPNGNRGMDDSSMQDEDPVNKRVGAIGGKKNKPISQKDKQRHPIGSGAPRNASLAGFRQAENVYQPFGGIGSSVFNGPRPMANHHYPYSGYDQGFGQPVYDNYAPIQGGYNPASFRGGFGQGFFPPDPQLYYPPQQVQTVPISSMPVRAGLKLYNNPYGAFLMRDNPQTDQHHSRQTVPGGNYMYEQNKRPQGTSNSAYDQDEEDEAKAGQSGYGYVPDEDEHYESYPDAGRRLGLDDSFAGNKQFKPALNNPFTLSGLGNSQVGQPSGQQGPGMQDYRMDYGWSKTDNFGMAGARDMSHNSHSVSSSSRNVSQLRPPPGLANEDENEVRERQTQDMQEANRDSNSNTDTGRGLANSSIQQPTANNKKKGNTKQQFSLFG